MATTTPSGVSRDVATPPVSKLQELFSEVSLSQSEKDQRKKRPGSVQQHRDFISLEKERSRTDSGHKRQGLKSRRSANVVPSRAHRTLNFGAEIEQYNRSSGRASAVAKTPDQFSCLIEESENFRVSNGRSPLHIQHSIAARALTDSKKKMKERLSTHSDTELLGAKQLIENALSTKTKQKRRLTEQLECIEQELWEKKKKRNSSTSMKSSRDSDTSLSSLQSELNEHGPRQSIECLFTNDDSEKPDIRSEDILKMEQVLELRHAELKAEHQDLKGEITGMTKQLTWIKRQLTATKGHARVLSKSTTDWADMMRRTQYSTALSEKKSTLRKGAIVMKHSTNKRGCGPRYLAVDNKFRILLWSKTLQGAFTISKFISEATGNVADIQGADVSTLSVDAVKQLVYGNDVTRLNFRSKQLLSVAFCQRTIGFESVFEAVDKVTLFEFPDSEAGCDFFMGLRSLLCDFSPSTLTAVSSSAKAETLSPVVNTAQFSGREVTPINRNEQHMAHLEEEDDDQSRFISAIQRDLQKVLNREDFIQVLKTHSMNCPLVLPLKSSKLKRHSVTDFDQVRKDFVREKNIIINARTFGIGNEKNFNTVKSYLKKRLSRDFSTDSDDERCESLCKELLLAASRTVMEGDVFTLCHQLLSVAGRVILCPAQTEQGPDTTSTPVEIFFAAGGLITIESETSYRVFGIESSGLGMEEWGIIKTRCIEHITYSHQGQEKNIRHVKIFVNEL